MTYGDPQRGLHTWTLTEEQSQPFFRQAIELGITHWDTANVYQQGTSEEFVGRAVKRYSRREHVQIATKVWGRMHDGPTGAGLSAPAIPYSCSRSPGTLTPVSRPMSAARVTAAAPNLSRTASSALSKRAPSFQSIGSSGCNSSACER